MREPYLLHVPQGKAARMHSASPAFGITGLHTDHFTTCQFIVCLGEDEQHARRLSLIHADISTLNDFEQIQQEILWANAHEVVLIFRDIGKEIVMRLRKHITDDPLLEKCKITLKEMDDQHDGIIVKYNKEKHNPGDEKMEEDVFHECITKLPIGSRPQNLRHHPDEQQLSSVQKIEQLIGLMHIWKNRICPRRKIMIHDGWNWRATIKKDLNVDTSNQLTAKEIKTFNKQDEFLIIASKLKKIAEALLKENIPYLSNNDVLENVFEISFHIESYISENEENYIFHKNISRLINKKNPGSIFSLENPEKEDTQFVKTCNRLLLADHQTFFEKFTALVNTYKQTAPDTGFKKQLLLEYEMFSKHYAERKHYSILREQYRNDVSMATKKAAMALKHHQKHEYAAASNLYLETVIEFSSCVKQDNPELIAAYYHCGSALMQCQKYKEAHHFLKACLSLREAFPKSSTPDKTQKAAKAVAYCEAALAKLAEERPGMAMGR